jgi:hypothetical protein
MYSLVKRWRNWTGAVAALLVIAGLVSWRVGVFDEPIPAMPECAPYVPAPETIGSTRAGVDKVLAPLGAIGILACEYRSDRAETTDAVTNRLIFRVVATRAEMSDLSTTFNVAVTAPPCTGGGIDSPMGYQIDEFVLRYHSGPDVRILVYYGTLCGAPSGPSAGLVATNGTVTGYIYLSSPGNALFDFSNMRA